MVFERKPQVSIESYTTEIVRSVNENTRRIRILEQSLEGSKSRISGLEQRVIDDMENLRKWADQLSVDIKEISNNLREIRGEILKINKDLDKTAKKTKVKELENLMELYSPIKSNFITRDQMQRTIEENIEDLKKR